MGSLLETQPEVAVRSTGRDWTYEAAFSRNRGLISAEEQARLRNSRIAIAGMGGVGGGHLITLARMGVGRFTIADPDEFEVANFNRQYGASCQHIGCNKAEVMADLAREINPDVDIEILPGPVTAENVGRFLSGADLFVDGVDAFAIAARRQIYRSAAERKLYAVGVGPVGFSAVWVTFSPDGMPFDRYFDLHDALSDRDLFLRYILGMAPASTQRKYLDLDHVDLDARQGPSLGLACQLASAVLATEAAKVLLRRGKIWPCPWYQQLDPYVGRWVRRKLRWGNRGPLQRIKRRILTRMLRDR